MTLKRKSVSTASFKASDTEEGVGEFIVNVFDVLDSYNDRSRMGCFTNSISQKMPKGVWAHDWNRPIAKTLEAEELAPGDARLPDAIKSYGGLWVKAAFNLAVQDGRDAYEHLKFGSVDEFSIGYYEVRTKKAQDGYLDLLQLDLVEWSPVLLGACPNTAVIEVKSDAGATGPKMVKSRYLGHWAEGSAAMAAVYSLCDSLFWYALYDGLYDDLDEGETVDDVLGEIEGAFDEFKSLSISIIRAIMTGAPGAEDAQKAAEFIRAKTANPNSPKVASPAGAAFMQQIDTTLAVVGDCVARATAICELRAKDGRALAEPRREKLVALKSSLDALLSAATPRASERDIIELQAEFLRAKSAGRPRTL